MSWVHHIMQLALVVNAMTEEGHGSVVQRSLDSQGLRHNDRIDIKNYEQMRHHIHPSTIRNYPHQMPHHMLGLNPYEKR